MQCDVGIRGSWKLHHRCHNCERNVFQRLDVPDVDDAPSDIDELLESALLQNLRFTCSACESAIGRLIAVTVWRDEEIAA